MMNLKSKTLAVGVIALFTIGIVGCSNPVESVVESLVDQPVSVDLDGDGSGKVTIDTEDGSFTVDTATGKLPEDLPEGIPLPPGTPEASSALENFWTMTYAGFSKADVEALIETVKADGFKEISNIDVDSQIQSVLTKGDIGISIIWGDSDTETTMIYGVRIDPNLQN